MRRLWIAAVHVGCEIQFGDGVAELFSADCKGERGGADRSQSWDGAGGNQLCPVRWAFGACFSGRAAADGAAVLLEFGVAGIHSERGTDEVGGPGGEGGK